jgi:hypothetical protein
MFGFLDRRQPRSPRLAVVIVMIVTRVNTAAPKALLPVSAPVETITDPAVLLQASSIDACLWDPICTNKVRLVKVKQARQRHCGEAAPCGVASI